MLDDLKLIHERDQYDALGIVEKQWQQLQHVYDLGDWKPTAEITNVVHSGMGGSSLWALIADSWPGFTLPFNVIRGYDVPSYINEHTLFIASSYSGNTEETISALHEAEQKNSQIVVMTAGGQLADIAKQKGYLFIELPKVAPPRYGCFYGLNGLITLGEHLGILDEKNILGQLSECGNFLTTHINGWGATVPTDRNLAKKLALEVVGKSPVIYGGPLLAPAAHKWKIGFNENSKNVAWEYAFPEFNHNEFTGWSSHPIDKPYTIFYLLSSFDNDRIKKRFDLSDKLLSGRWPSPERIEAKGETKLEQLLWSVSLGDFVTLYTALLNGTSPIELGDKDIIERFKKELNS